MREPTVGPIRALLTISRDPFHPGRAREVLEVGAPVALASLVPPLDLPHILLRNGDPLLRAQWDDPVAHGDHLVLMCLPQGGGQGGSDPMRIGLTIALMVATQGMGSGLVAEGGLLAGSGLTAAQASGLAFMAGSLLVNAVIPPPKQPSNLAAAALAAPSPTYSLQAQGNTARLDAAIPVQYGRLAGYPDLAAQPYQEYSGNEQYIYQLLCVGQGAYEIEEVRIEDTPVANFEEIAYEVVEPGGTITLFPAGVVTSTEVAGAEVVGAASGTYSRSGTTITVTLTAHALSVGRVVNLDITSGAAVDGEYTVTAAPTADTFTVTSAASGATSGNVTVTRYLGGFNAATAGTVTTTLGLDFVATRGLYTYNSSTGAVTSKSITVEVTYRPIDSAGAPTGAWVALSETFTDSTTTPQRYSRRYDVAPGRYQVRVRRADAKDSSSSVGHEIAWAGLRSYLQSSNTFGDVTLIAMRMRASNNLSGMASRKVNVIATRKLPVWTGSSWSAPVATRGPAWAFADACRNTTYGGGLADARIDLAALLALADVWEGRGDSFDGRFDNTITLWEALGKIAGAGRARPFMQGGIVRVVRDAPQALPVALFSMRNIQRGSFSVDYSIPSDTTPDCVDVGYFDQTQWAPQRVTAALPGSSAQRPARLDLFGVTSRDQAYREGLYHAAAAARRRRTIRFSTEMEGFIPSLGDLVAVSHDMPAWGQGAEAVQWTAATRTLVLSEPLTWGSGAHYVGLRAADGSVDGPWPVSPGADAYTVVLADAPGITPYTGSAYERTHVVFGPGQTWSQLALVTAVRPRGAESVEIECVNDDPSVHTVEDGVIAPPVIASQLPTLYTAPEVLGLTLRSSSNDVGTALISWQAAPGAEYYVIEMAPALTGAAWTRVGESTASNFAVSALYGAGTWIRVAAYGATRGPWVAINFAAAADYMWTSDAALMWNASSATLMWH